MTDCAVILAGGLGTRLGEITESIPKPMVKIGEKPILWHIMKNYSSFGVNEFIILAGYKSEMIKSYFVDFLFQNSNIMVETKTGKIRVLEDDTDDWKVSIIDTGQNVLTGTRIKRSEPFIEHQNFFLTYGDGLSNIDHGKVKNKMISGNGLISLTAVNPPGRYGQIEIANGQVNSFHEKNSEIGHINGGFFAINIRLLSEMDSSDFSFETDFLPEVANSGNLDAHIHDGFWQSMDTPRDVKILNDIWETGNAPWKTW